MRKMTLAGHPLHPQLIGIPAGLLPFSFAMDTLYLVTDKKSYADAAYYSMVGGTAGALAAGAAGAMDYLTIKPGGHTKKIANTHALMNIAITGLYALNIALRKRRNRRPSGWEIALSGLCTAGLVVSQWYGGHLVYEHGMRVRGRSELADVPEAKLPGDSRLARALERLDQPMTARGPHWVAGRQDSHRAQGGRSATRAGEEAGAEVQAGRGDESHPNAADASQESARAEAITEAGRRMADRGRE